MRVRRRRVSKTAPPTAEKKWYIVHTYSGSREQGEAEALLGARQDAQPQTDYFGDGARSRRRSVTEKRQGSSGRNYYRQVLPRLHVRADGLDDRTFHLVKNTPKIATASSAA